MGKDQVQSTNDIDPVMIGKTSEYQKVTGSLDNAMEGNGSVILLEGEAGIGKTHLIDLVQKDAAKKGFTVMKGNCLDYRRSPYLPFKHMLMDHFNITLLGSYEKNREKVVSKLKSISLLDKEFQEDLMDLFIPKDELIGGYQIHGERMEDLKVYLRRSGYRIVILTDREDIEEFQGDRSLEMIRIGDAEDGMVPPTRLERLATLLKGSFHRYRHCAVINDGLGTLRKKNPDKKLKSLIKILNGLADESDSLVIHMDRGGSGGLLKNIRDLSDRIKEEDDSSGKDPSVKMSKNEVLNRFMTRVSDEGPLLLILEDLQWGDKHSLNLLQLMGRDISHKRVLILGSYRPEESVLEGDAIENAPLRDALQRISRERLFDIVTLSRLDREQQKDFVEELTCSVPDDGLMERIDAMTRGNPGFIKRYIDEMGREKQVVECAPSTNDSADENTIARKISGLDIETRTMLEFASVMGEMSRLNMIVDGLEMDEEEALDRLDRLINLKLLKEMEEVLKFEHPRWKDIVYNGIEPEKLADLHMRAALQIESNPHFHGEERMSLLGDHYMKGGDMLKAHKAFFNMGEIAKEKMDNNRARSFFEKALSSLDDLSRSKENISHRIRTLHRIGDIKKETGDFRGSLISFKEAVNLAEASHLPHGMSSSYRRIGDVMIKLFEWDQTLDYYLRSLHLSKKEDDQDEISKAFKGLGTIYYLKGDYARSMECYLKYMEYPRNERSPSSILALVEIGDIYFEMGDFNQSLTYYKMAIKNGEEEDIKIESALSYERMANVLLKLGEVDDAKRFATWGYNMVKAYSLTDISERTVLGYAELMIETSDLEKAEEALSLVGDPGDKQMMDLLFKGELYRTIGLLAAKKRNFEKAKADLQKALEIHQMLKVPFQLGLTYFQYGLVKFQEMDLENALEMINESSNIFKSIRSIYYSNRASSKIRELNFIKD